MMSNHTESAINVSWKPDHMVNQGKGYSVRTANKEKTSSAYTRWWGMFMRCYNPDDKGYDRYGARGVTVCSLWGNYQNFAKWYYSKCTEIGIDPENNNYHIDKDIEGALEYCPDTCNLISAGENIALGTSKEHEYVSPTGEVVTITNLNKFCRDNNLIRKQMYRLLNNTCQSHRGWRIKKCVQ